MHHFGAFGGLSSTSSSLLKIIVSFTKETSIIDFQIFIKQLRISTDFGGVWLEYTSDIVPDAGIIRHKLASGVDILY